MGMPISLALRGRHAHDGLGHEAWREALAILHNVDEVFSTYRFDSVISASDGVSFGRRTARLTSSRYSTSVDLPSSSQGEHSISGGPAPAVSAYSTPAGS